jgi:hypothetical protein
MPDIITNQDAQYALNIVKTICSEVGPGLPGSSQERERASIIKQELESHLGAGNVQIEEFTLAPDAFLSPYPIVICMVITVLLNTSMGHITGLSPWLTAMAALVFSTISSLIFIFEFIFGFELVDPIFKKKQSLNVVGRLRKPGTETAERLLILSGHHDSALENTWLRWLGYGYFFLSATFFIGLVTMLGVSLIQLMGLIANNVGMVRIGTLGWASLVYPILPSIIYVLFNTRGRKNGGNVPGAADNLSGSAVAVALCRFLVKNPAYIPPDTEIRFISFGSEEAGLRGSRRYVERHLEELKHLDARLLNFETVVHPVITILTSDLNGTRKHSPEMVKSVVAAAKLAAVPYKVASGSLGVGTDAAPFSRAGLQATTLLPFKVPQQMVAFYHQKWDGPENLTLEPLLNVLKLTFEWVSHGGE